MIQRLCFSSCTQMKEPKKKTKFSSFFSLFTNWDNLTILIMGKKSCPSVLQTAVQTQKQMWTILRNIVLQINNMINEKVNRTFHFYNFKDNFSVIYLQIKTVIYFFISFYFFISKNIWIFHCNIFFTLIWLFCIKFFLIFLIYNFYIIKFKFVWICVF